MAQMSKRNRDAMRFGKPERLADLILSGIMAEIPGVFETTAEIEYCRARREEMKAACRSLVVDSTAVSDYVLSLPEDVVGWGQMVADAQPSFESCFVEARISPEKSPQVRHAGWSIRVYSKGSEPQSIYDGLMWKPAPDAYARCSRIVFGSMALGVFPDTGGGQEGVLCPTAGGFVMLDDRGEAVLPPYFEMARGWVRAGQDDWLLNWAKQSFFSAMLAFSFLNRKVATMVEIPPDAEVNRNRRKEGLHPFVPCRTIRIDPTKLAAVPD